MSRFLNVARDAAGNAVGPVLVTVFDAGTETLSALFSDHALTVPAPNPFTGQANGSYSFFAPSGEYKIRVEREGFVTWEEDFITLPAVIAEVPGGGPPGGGDGDEEGFVLESVLPVENPPVVGEPPRIEPTAVRTLRPLLLPPEPGVRPTLTEESLLEIQALGESLAPEILSAVQAELTARLVHVAGQVRSDDQELIVGLVPRPPFFTVTTRRIA